jgi:hypothetical protein
MWWNEYYALDNGWSLFVDFGNGDGFCDVFIFNADTKIVEDMTAFNQDIPALVDSVESVGKYNF